MEAQAQHGRRLVKRKHAHVFVDRHVRLNAAAGWRDLRCMRRRVTLNMKGTTAVDRRRMTFNTHVQV